ncbi:hypothetical protein NFI96_032633 [Prochilodus magdalenae]|nr:hypothetical protein NFI96_032633 [Prochilodus magdalenae]
MDEMDAKLGPACREDSPSNQSTITGAFAKCTKHKRDSAEWRECTTGVPRYIVTGLLPFSTVEKSSSREVLQTLNSQYQLPSHTYSRTAVPETCDNVRAEVQCLIKRATTDMWSGTNLTPYTSLTVHFIPPQWKLDIKCLETMFFQTAPLQPDCSTRWGSKPKMTERVTEQSQAIGRVPPADRRAPSLTWQDPDVLEAMNKALKPAADFTDIWSGEDYVTDPSLRPTLPLLNGDILSQSETDVQLTKDIDRGIGTELGSKYDGESTGRLTRTTAFLDPRFRGGRLAEDDLRQTKAGPGPDKCVHETSRG